MIFCNNVWTVNDCALEKISLIQNRRWGIDIVHVHLYFYFRTGFSDLIESREAWGEGSLSTTRLLNWFVKCYYINVCSGIAKGRAPQCGKNYALFFLNWLNVLHLVWTSLSLSLSLSLSHFSLSLSFLLWSAFSLSSLWVSLLFSLYACSLLDPTNGPYAPGLVRCVFSTKDVAYHAYGQNWSMILVPGHDRVPHHKVYTLAPH